MPDPATGSREDAWIRSQVAGGMDPTSARAMAGQMRARGAWPDDDDEVLASALTPTPPTPPTPRREPDEPGLVPRPLAPRPPVDPLEAAQSIRQRRDLAESQVRERGGSEEEAVRAGRLAEGEARLVSAELASEAQLEEAALGPPLRAPTVTLGRRVVPVVPSPRLGAVEAEQERVREVARARTRGEAAAPGTYLPGGGPAGAIPEEALPLVDTPELDASLLALRDQRERVARRATAGEPSDADRAALRVLDRETARLERERWDRQHPRNSAVLELMEAGLAKLLAQVVKMDAASQRIAAAQPRAVVTRGGLRLAPPTAPPEVRAAALREAEELLSTPTQPEIDAERRIEVARPAAAEEALAFLGLGAEKPVPIAEIPLLAHVVGRPSEAEVRETARRAREVVGPAGETAVLAGGTAAGAAIDLAESIVVPAWYADTARWLQRKVPGVEEAQVALLPEERARELRALLAAATARADWDAEVPTIEDAAARGDSAAAWASLSKLTQEQIPARARVRVDADAVVRWIATRPDEARAVPELTPVLAALGEGGRREEVLPALSRVPLRALPEGSVRWSLPEVQAAIRERREASERMGGATGERIAGVLTQIQYEPGTYLRGKTESTAGGLMRVPAALASELILEADVPIAAVGGPAGWIGYAIAESVADDEEAPPWVRTWGQTVRDLRLPVLPLGGLPVPSAAGIDHMLASPSPVLREIREAIGVRDYRAVRDFDTTWWSRVRANLETGVGGSFMHATNILHNAGVDEGSALDNAVKWAAIGLDFLYPWERKSLGLPISGATRIGRGLDVVSAEREAGAAPTFRAWTMGAVPEAFPGTLRDADLATAMGVATREAASRATARGDSALEALSGGDREVVAETARVLGLDWRDVSQQYETATHAQRRVHLDAVRELLRHRTAEDKALRASAPYRAMAGQLDVAVKDGRLEPGEALFYLGLREQRAWREVASGEMGTPEESFARAPVEVRTEAGPAEGEPAGAARVPLVVTRRMRDGLRAQGHADADIDRMTPSMAWAFLEAEAAGPLFERRVERFEPREPSPERRTAAAEKLRDLREGVLARGGDGEPTARLETARREPRFRRSPGGGLHVVGELPPDRLARLRLGELPPPGGPQLRYIGRPLTVGEMSDAAYEGWRGDGGPVDALLQDVVRQTPNDREASAGETIARIISDAEGRAGMAPVVSRALQILGLDRTVDFAIAPGAPRDPVAAAVNATPWFHGTPRGAISLLDYSLQYSGSGAGNMLGPGLYLAADPEVAIRYAGAMPGTRATSAALKTVEVRLRNVLDLRGSTAEAVLVLREAGAHALADSLAATALETRWGPGSQAAVDAWQDIGRPGPSGKDRQPEIVRAALAAGFDGLLHYGRRDGDVLVLFDPNANSIAGAVRSLVREGRVLPERELYARERGRAVGMYDPATGLTALFRGGDLGTLLHEDGHLSEDLVRELRPDLYDLYVDAFGAEPIAARPTGRHPRDVQPDRVGVLRYSMGLREAETAIAAEANEHAVAFAHDGRQVGRWLGGPTGIAVDEPTRRMTRALSRDGALTTVHNHPNGTPISAADMAMALLTGVSEVRVVTPDGRSHSVRFLPETTTFFLGELMADGTPGPTLLALADALDAAQWHAIAFARIGIADFTGPDRPLFLRRLEDAATAEFAAVLDRYGHAATFESGPAGAARLRRPGLAAPVGGSLGRGGGVLSRAGRERAADAWRWYVLTRGVPNGRVRLLFDALHLTLADLWARVRGRAATIPPEVRAAWDAEFRPHEIARSDAVRIGGREALARFPVVRIPEEGAAPHAVVERAGKAREARRIARARREVLQDLGLRPGEEVSVGDLVPRMLAYVKTEQSRRLYGTGTLVRLTTRTIVPEARLPRVAGEALRLLVGALGTTPDKLERKGDRLLLTSGQAAGIRALANELAREPMGDIVPERLVLGREPLEHLTLDELDRLQEAALDTRAGVGARRSRRTEAVPPTVGYRVWQAISGGAKREPVRAALSGAMLGGGVGAAMGGPVGALAGAAVGGMAFGNLDWFRQNFVVPRVGEGYLDPAVQDIVERGFREMGTSQRELLDAARRYHEGTPGAVVRDTLHSMRRVLVPPVDPPNVRTIRGVLSELYGEEVVPRAAALLADGRLASVEGALDELGGRSDEERAALVVLHSYADADVFSVEGRVMPEDERAALSDAIGVVERGLRRRWSAVQQRGANILVCFAGTPDRRVLERLRPQDYENAYVWFYTGDWDRILDWADSVGLETGRAVDRPPRFDREVAVMEALVRLRALDHLERMAERLTDYGIGTKVEELDIAGSEVRDRSAFADRVLHYVNELTSWRANMLVQAEAGRPRGRVSRMPVAPETVGVPWPEMVEARAAGAGALASRFPASPVDAPDGPGNPHDMAAYTEARRLLDAWGFKSGAVWERFTWPDGSESLVPAMVAEAIQEQLAEVSRVGEARGAAPTFGRARIEPLSGVGEPPEPGERLEEGGVERAPAGMERTAVVRAKTGVAAAVSELLNKGAGVGTGIRLGVTVGPLLPNAAYFVGNFLGGALQNYAKAGIRGMSEALVGEPMLTLAVVRRLWGDGRRAEGMGLLVDGAGRVWTADRIADAFDVEGLKSSFASAESARSMAQEIRDLHRPQWEKFMLAPVQWQRWLVETATAIDNFWRVGMFISELKKGRSPAEAAASARASGFDYAALAKTEKTVMRNVVLFYSYMRKNADLWWDTLLRNPDRIVGQLRLMKDLNEWFLEPEPEILRREDLDLRVIVGFRRAAVNTAEASGVTWAAPPLPVGDHLGLWVDLYDSIAGAKMDNPAVRGLVSRSAPWVQFPFVAATGSDISFGRDLDDYADVPPWMVQIDYLLGGGIMGPVFGVRKVREPDPARWWRAGDPYVWRVRSDPGRAQALAWFAFRNLGSFLPGVGRSMDTVTMLDRANVGAVELVERQARLARFVWDREVRDGKGGYKLIPTGDPVEPRYGLTEADELAGYLGWKPVVVPTWNTQLDTFERRKLGEVREEVRAAEKARMPGRGEGTEAVGGP